MSKVKQSERTAETIPGEPPANLLAVRSRWDVQLGDPPERWPTNLDLATERGRAILLNATNPPSIQMREGESVRMRLRHYVCWVAEVEDREHPGELSVVPKCCLISTDGQTFVTSSAYAKDKMANMSAVFSQARWERGIPIIVREHHSERTKRDSHVIDLDMSAEW